MSAVADRAAADRRGRRADRYDTAHDPLLRGDRAAARGGDRAQGKHRCYTEADVERVNEIVRLRDLLGLSLEQLSQLLEAESARAELRREYAQTDDAAERGRGSSTSRSATSPPSWRWCRSRRRELEQLERELVDKRRSISKRLADSAPEIRPVRERVPATSAH